MNDELLFSLDKMKTFHRWRTQILMAGIIVMGLYMLVFRGHSSSYDPTELDIDLEAIEQEIENGKTVGVVTYQVRMNDLFPFNHKL